MKQPFTLPHFSVGPDHPSRQQHVECQQVKRKVLLEVLDSVFPPTSHGQRVDNLRIHGNLVVFGHLRSKPQQLVHDILRPPRLDQAETRQHFARISPVAAWLQKSLEGMQSQSTMDLVAIHGPLHHLGDPGRHHHSEDENPDADHGPDGIRHIRTKEIPGKQPVASKQQDITKLRPTASAIDGPGDKEAVQQDDPQPDFQCEFQGSGGTPRKTRHHRTLSVSVPGTVISTKFINESQPDSDHVPKPYEPLRTWRAR